MPHSMTGFGRYETNGEEWTIGWEIKSVNSRFLDIKWRLPAFLRSQESALEKVVRSEASRGRVEIFCNVQLSRPEQMGVGFNHAQANAMLDELEAFARGRGLDFTPDPMRLMNISALWQDRSVEPDPSLMAEVTATLERALEVWNLSRSQEGASLAEDLAQRIGTLAELTSAIARRVPAVLSERTANLKARVAEMLESQGAEYDEDRMLQEVAIVTDKLDVSEELTRLDTHLERIRKVLFGGGEMGKRLDFLVQETFREINTCGNKAQDGELSRLVVDFKAELEKCREQVQNLE